jgi:hypothetical protein
MNLQASLDGRETHMLWLLHTCSTLTPWQLETREIANYASLVSPLAVHITAGHDIDILGTCSNNLLQMN